MHNTWHLKPEHSFTKLWLEPYCTELRNMCKRQKFMFLEKRSYLLKFLDLFDGLGKYKYSPILILYQNFLVNTLIWKMNKVPKCCISWGTTRSGMNDEDWHIYKKLLSCNTLAATVCWNSCCQWQPMHGRQQYHSDVSDFDVTAWSCSGVGGFIDSQLFPFYTLTLIVETFWMILAINFVDFLKVHIELGKVTKFVTFRPFFFGERLLREGSKKRKVENSTLGGGEVGRGHFPLFDFLFFMLLMA